MRLSQCDAAIRAAGPEGRMVQTQSPDTRGTASNFEAMKRGFFGRCPNCGEGRMFRAFLKVADHCPACREELHHHQADDFPAYVVIVIVGHILVPLVLLVETHLAPPFWVGMTVWPAAVVVLTLALIQPVKGAIVGLQWAMGMHGFNQAKKDREALRDGLASVAGPGRP